MFFVCTILTFGLVVSIDPRATPETRDLHDRLLFYSENPKYILFGHADDTVNGIYGWHPPYTRISNRTDGGWSYSTKQAVEQFTDELSDVKSVTGSYPAVIDFGLYQMSPNHSIVTEHLIKRAVKHRMVPTLSQHLFNPVTGGSFWVQYDHGDVRNTVKRILPGGDTNWKFNENLDKIATMLLRLKDDAGRLIPVLFRPLHEMNGDWFWWGLNNRCNNSVSDLIALYRYIVSYLQDTKNVHNVLYVFSPDKFKDKNDYLKLYPGDDFVDVIATDFYYKTEADKKFNFSRTISDLVDIAESKKKIAALSETGLFHNGIDKETNFWNEKVLDVLKWSTKTRKIAYMMAWSNGCFVTNCTVWVPYSGHPAEQDFRNNFFRDVITVFGSTYTRNKLN